MNNINTADVDFLKNQVKYSTLAQMIEQDERRTQLVSLAKKTITYIFLIVVSLVILFPFYWMVITAFKSFEEVNSIVPTFFPTTIMWENFLYTINNGSSNFYKILGNTVLVATVSTIGTVIITILSAYAFSIFEFRGKNALFGLFLVTMMIPAEMLIMTNYLTIGKFGLKDTYIALILPFLVSVFYIFFLRQSFKQIPKELYYAAKVDGAKDFKYLTKVMIPLAKPTIITIIILNFISAWNSFLWPSIINTSDMQLISNWLRTSFTDIEMQRPFYNYQMMAALIASLPILIMFIFLKKYIMQSVSRSGIKG